MRAAAVGLAAGGLLAMALACRFTTDLAQPQDPLDRAVQATATALAPTPTPTRLPRRSCPVPAGRAELPDLQRGGSTAAALTTYLNQGGSLRALHESLLALGAAPGGERLAEADLNADGWLDLAVSVVNPESTAPVPGGTLYVFLCQGEAYRLVFTTPNRAERGAPVLYAAQDLNSDLRAELLLGHPSCGAHTCFELVEVLTLAGETLVNILDGSSDDLPSPQVELQPGSTQGSFEIRVTGTAIHSVGAGPYRPRTRTWTWDEGAKAFLQGSDVLQPTTFRIHVLHDADRAAALGDFAQALTLYSEVVQNPGLQEWVNPEAERQILAAYARFRRIVTLLQIDDLDGARVEYGELLAAYPPESVGRPFAEMGEAFWAEVQAEGDLAQACRRARSFAVTRSSEILDPLYFGYANPSYNAADLCPIGGTP